MRGYHFSDYKPDDSQRGGFNELLNLFTQLLNYTAGDAGDALAWMNELDKQYKLTNNEYAMGDFIDDLKDKGYITESPTNGEISITAKTENKIPVRGPFM